MIWLAKFLGEHPDEVAYDLIGLGLRLRDFPSARLSWADLLVIVQQAPPDSAVVRTAHPELSEWMSPLKTNQMLHSVEFSLRQLVWSKSEDAAKGRKRSAPKPIPAPWVKDDKEREVKHFGSAPIPIADLNDFLGWAM